MLKKLSIRNAKRQIKNYLIFIVTMSSAVALIYSFNSLIFSDAVNSIMGSSSSSNQTYLTIMIIMFSLLIVFILGWFVRYMMNFILRKRSQELGTYMILGLEKTEITRMFLFENSIIGMAAFIMGLLLGFLLAEILNAIFTNTLGGTYALSSGFSIKAVGLSLLYFSLIYIFALLGNRRMLKKMQLIELLSYEKHNEESHMTKSWMGITIFCISILCGIGSLLLFVKRPLGNPLDGYGFDYFLGIILSALCLFGMFFGLLPLMHNILAKNKKWKYRNANMLLYRLLTSKINNITRLLAGIAAVFTAAITVFGSAITFNIMTNKSLDMEAFDIKILHMNEEYDFSQYEEFLFEISEIKFSYTYTLYTKYDKTFMSIRDDTLAEYLEMVGNKWPPKVYTYKENQYDSYMKYSDYCVLREMLGLEQVEMGENDHLIHCMPYLRECFEEYTSTNKELNDFSLSCAGIYTEDFAQYEGYGNGQEFILIVPDEIADQMDVLYSNFVANCSSYISNENLDLMQNNFGNLVILNSSSLTSSAYADDDGYVSILSDEGMDYLSGKSVGSSYGEKLSIILPMFYLSLILCMIGMVILAVQLLSDNKKYNKHYNMLSVLGMGNVGIKKTLRNQLLQYFSLPLIPAILLGTGLVIVISYRLFTTSYHAPVFNSIVYSIMSAVLVALALFLIIYIAYVIVSYVTFKRDVLKDG